MTLPDALFSDLIATLTPLLVTENERRRRFDAAFQGEPALRDSLDPHAENPRQYAWRLVTHLRERQAGGESALLRYVETARREAQADGMADRAAALGGLVARLRAEGRPAPGAAVGEGAPVPARPASLPPSETVRALLTAAFSDGELTTFAFDHFRAVYEDFASGMARSDKVQRLVEYAETHGETARLLALVKQANPYQYERLIGAAPVEPPAPPRASIATPPGDPRRPDAAPLRLLFLAANPADTGRLQVDEEMRTIRERLREAQALARFDFAVELAVRERDLPRIIMEVRPTLIHFSGHGEEGGAIVLADQRGESHLLTPARLTELFDIFRGQVQGVIFNACWSQPQAEALVEGAGVPWVVGMARTIEDAAARDFAAGFYRALGFGENVARAFRLGCFELAGDHPDERDTPRLLVGPGVDAETLSY